MLSSSSSLFSMKYIIQGVAAAALTAAIVVPAVITNSAHASERIAAAQQLSESSGMHHEQLSVYAGIVRDRLDAEAASTISTGTQTVKANSSTVPTAAASQAITQLASYEKLPDTTVRARIDVADAAIHSVAVKAAEVRQAALAKAQAVRAQALANTPDGARATAHTMMAQKYGWGDSEFQCLSNRGRRSPAGRTRPTTRAAARPASRRRSPAARWRAPVPTGRPTHPRRSAGVWTTSPARTARRAARGRTPRP
jgi:hypothetical protein